MPRKKPRQIGRKVRVEFRQNREARARNDHWTRSFHQDTDATADASRGEQVRAKGALSRKRTIIVPHDDAPVTDESLWRPGLITAMFGLVNRVEDSAGRQWACTLRRVLRTRQIAERAAVTVGDRVWFSPIDAPPASARADAPAESGAVSELPAGVIERVAERTTRLSRRERRGREHALVANADQLLIVASVSQPRIKPHLIDRFLVAAAKGGLRPIVCINKIDLSHHAFGTFGDLEHGESTLESDGAGEDPAEVLEDEFDEDAGGADESFNRYASLDDLVGEFRRAGCTVLCTSVRDRAGLAELAEALHGHLTVLAGQSGVGKSSLLNALQPELNLATGEVSRDNEKGRHTTSHAWIHRLSIGGHVVDTPGIRQFDLWAVEPGELEACFAEFLPLISKCRFSNCLHVHEDGCAVYEAMAAGVISTRRYASYAKMLAEAQAATLRRSR
ncbi:MAG: ribosome small subunit-dependent GTPase A [Phycisphaerae bacterium]